MSISSTDTLYNGINKSAPLVSSSVGLVLALYVTMTPSYGALYPNSFMENKTASKSDQGLDSSITVFSSSATNTSIYTTPKFSESFHDVNVDNEHENVDNEHEDDAEDLLSWDIWIDRPSISKTVTIKAKFIKGNFILPSIYEDAED